MTATHSGNLIFPHKNMSDQLLQYFDLDEVNCLLSGLVQSTLLGL